MALCVLLGAYASAPERESESEAEEKAHLANAALQWAQAMPEAIHDTLADMLARR